MPLLNLQPLLGGIFGQSSPQVDPRIQAGVQVDEDGNLIDNNGNTLSDQSAFAGPYKKPNLWTQMFNPSVANTETAGNNAYNLAPAEAEQSARAQLAGKKTLLSSLSSQFAGQTPDQLASTLLNFGSEGGLNQNIEQRAYGITGAPGAVGEAMGHTDPINAQTSLQNAQALNQRTPLINKMLGTNALTDFLSAARAGLRQPIVDDVRDIVAGNELDRSQNVVPKQNLFESNQLRFGLGQQPTTQDTEANINAIRKGMSDTELEQLPTAQATSAAQSRNLLYDTLHPNVPPMFYRSGAGFARNPASPSIMEQMTGKMQSSGGNQGTGTIPLGGGLHLPIAPTQSTATSAINGGSRPLISPPILPQQAQAQAQAQPSSDTPFSEPQHEGLTKEDKEQLDKTNAILQQMPSALKEQWLQRFHGYQKFNKARGTNPLLGNLIGGALSSIGVPPPQ